MNDVIDLLTPIFRDILENDHLLLTPQTTASDIAEWDSLSHIQLVVGIEKKLKIKFTTTEIQSWQNVGDMCQSVANKFQK